MALNPQQMAALQAIPEPTVRNYITSGGVLDPGNLPPPWFIQIIVLRAHGQNVDALIARHRRLAAFVAPPSNGVISDPQNMQVLQQAPPAQAGPAQAAPPPPAAPAPGPQAPAAGAPAVGAPAAGGPAPVVLPFPQAPVAPVGVAAPLPAATPAQPVAQAPVQQAPQGFRARLANWIQGNQQNQQPAPADYWRPALFVFGPWVRTRAGRRWHNAHPQDTEPPFPVAQQPAQAPAPVVHHGNGAGWLALGVVLTAIVFVTAAILFYQPATVPFDPAGRDGTQPSGTQAPGAATSAPTAAPATAAPATAAPAVTPAPTVILAGITCAKLGEVLGGPYELIDALDDPANGFPVERQFDRNQPLASGPNEVVLFWTGLYTTDDITFGGKVRQVKVDGRTGVYLLKPDSSIVVPSPFAALRVQCSANELGSLPLPADFDSSSGCVDRDVVLEAINANKISNPNRIYEMLDQIANKNVEARLRSLKTPWTVEGRPLMTLIWVRSGAITDSAVLAIDSTEGKTLYLVISTATVQVNHQGAGLHVCTGIDPARDLPWWGKL